MNKVIRYLIKAITKQERLLKAIVSLKTKVELLEMTNKDLYCRIEVLKLQREQENKEMYTFCKQTISNLAEIKAWIQEHTRQSWKN